MPDATTVFLLRHAAHGLVDHVLCGRMPGVGLSDAGLRQAARLGARMAGESLAALYASPQRRARETALEVARRCGDLPVQTATALAEIDVGDWTGREFAALADDPCWRRWNVARAGAGAPGGESMAEVQERALGWALSLTARHGGAAVAAVSHADVIKAMIAGVLGLSLDRHDSLAIDPASVSAIAIWQGGARVLLVNETAETAA